MEQHNDIATRLADGIHSRRRLFSALAATAGVALTTPVLGGAGVKVKPACSFSCENDYTCSGPEYSCSPVFKCTAFYTCDADQFTCVETFC